MTELHAATDARAATAPKPRSPGIDLDTPIPRHWLGGNAAATHLANGVNLLFPAGERFFVRSVNRYLDRVGPALRAQVKGFFGQEGRHAREHERAFRLLEEQGFDVKRFLDFYERVAYGMIERVAPPELSLAVTAACEHFTAIMAEGALTGDLLDRAHPTMRALLAWHAAEEIEHRSVAFDVLQIVNPSYALRVSGLALATLCLGGFWLLGAISLMRQDETLTLRKARRQLRDTRDHRVGRDVFLRGIREYLRRDFHPAQKTHLDDLAAEYLAAAGIA